MPWESVEHPKLAEQYVAELRAYLAGPTEDRLRRAYELGRQAVGEGLGVLEIASVHQSALAALLDEPGAWDDRERIQKPAAQFFTEILSPFEMALRGFGEANEALRRNIEELEAAEEELSEQYKKLAEANRAVQAERQRYRELFEFAPDGYIVTDLQGIIQEANSAAVALFRAASDSLPGTTLAGFIALEERHAFEVLLGSLQAGKSEDVIDWEARVAPRDAEPFAGSLTVSRMRTAHGSTVGLLWMLRDITERKRVEEDRARMRIRERVARAEAEAGRRLEFLAEASRLLTVSLDSENSLADVATLAVPYLADWCSAYVVESGVTHGIPARRHLRQELTELPPENRPPECVRRVLRTGKSEIIEPGPSLSGLATDPEHLRFFRPLAIDCAMVVPILCQGHTAGALAFFSAGRRYGPADLVLAEDLAHRCSVAIDNARLYRQVIIERDRAEKASRAKDEFVAVLSHELRNPLMPILGWTRIFKNQPALARDPLLGEGVRSLERNALNIERIVEDCLDLARISERKITLESERLDVNQVAEASIEAVRELAYNKDIKLVVQLSAAPLPVAGDRTRLQQSLMNLLTNAIRYTDGGGLVTIESTQDDSYAEVRVRDTGIGIAADFLDNIFEPFRQGTSSWLTSDSGLGLGLAVAQQIAEMHGGQIVAESEGAGQGSTFRLRLPLALAQPAFGQAGEETARPEEPGQTGQAMALRVLVIEDSHDILHLMKVELEGLGYSVWTAAEGNSGLEMALRLHPDVIISDIRMPGLDGYELIRRVRQEPELAAVPAIALTGFGMKKDMEKAMAAGYTAHLVKPVDCSELSALIQNLISARNAHMA